MSLPPEHQRLARLAPLTEIHAHLWTLAPVAARSIDVVAAAGRVLAADVAVPAPVPVTSVALRDGWAVQSATVADAGPYTPLALVPAPAWVETGAPVPHPADAVLAPDAMTVSGDMAEALAPAGPGADVLGPGEDASSGHVLRHAGERLRNIDIAALRAAGIPRIKVHEPRVRIFSANRLIDAVDDTVAPLLAHAVDAAGGAPTVERATGEGHSLKDALLGDDADAVIAIGGTGAGRHDGSVRTLAHIGRVDIHGMGVRPGETAAMGSVGPRPVLLLPGRLDAALAIWLVVGQQLLKRLTGLSATEPSAKTVLARKIISTIGLAEVVLVGHCDGGVEPLASGYFPLQSLTRATGWVLVPPESEGFAAGATVDLRPLP